MSYNNYRYFFCLAGIVSAKERVAARSFLSHAITTISEMVADYFICLLCGI